MELHVKIAATRSHPPSQHVDGALSSAFERAMIGMAMVSFDGRYIRVNGALCRLLGRSPDELLQSTVLDVTHPDDVDRSETLLTTALVQRRPSYEMHKRYLHRDGQCVPVLLSVSLCSDRHEQPLCFLGQVIDLSQIREAEADRERSLRHLIMIEDDERAHLAREVHDELGQILTSISLLAKGLEDRLGGASGKEVADLRRATDDAFRAVRVLTAKARPPHLEFGLEAALEELVCSVQEQTALRVDLEVSPLGMSISDELQTACYRICQEALSNVAKHAGPGASARIEVERRGEVITVTVVDDGNGLDSDSAASDRSGGTGLRHMDERARLVGGALHIDSCPGRGTTLRLTAPCAPAGPLNRSPDPECATLP